MWLSCNILFVCGHWEYGKEWVIKKKAERKSEVGAIEQSLHENPCIGAS